MINRRRPGVAAAAALALLTGCSSGHAPQRVVTVTVPPTGAPSSPSSSSAGSATGASGAAGTSASATPSGGDTATALPGPCDSLLPDYTVAQAIGRSAFTGGDAFVVGVPEKDIGRLATINCRYGVTGRGSAQKAAVEIGVSLYRTTEQAAQRISATVSDYQAHGASPATVTAAGQPAQLLTGGAGDGYTDPLLVLAAGRRTIAVTVGPSIATGAEVQGTAAKIAAVALTKTAG